MLVHFEAILIFMCHDGITLETIFKSSILKNIRLRNPQLLNTEYEYIEQQKKRTVNTFLSYMKLKYQKYISVIRYEQCNV